MAQMSLALSSEGCQESLAGTPKSMDPLARVEKILKKKWGRRSGNPSISSGPAGSGKQGEGAKSIEKGGWKAKNLLW